MVAARLILASTSWAGRRATVAFLAFEQALLDVANWYGKEKDSRFSLAPPRNRGGSGGGNSSSWEAAKARCAATAMSPDQRATQAVIAAGRSLGTAAARCRARRRRNCQLRC